MNKKILIVGTGQRFVSLTLLPNPPIELVNIKNPIENMICEEIVFFNNAPPKKQPTYQERQKDLRYLTKRKRR